MGNKSTFVILLMMNVITFFGLDSYATVYTNNGIACTKTPGKYLCESATKRSNHCVLVADNNKKDNWKLCPKAASSQPDPEEVCSKKGPNWMWRNQQCVDITTDSADQDGTTPSICAEKEGVWKSNELPHCCLDEPNAIAKAACTPDKGTWDKIKKICEPKTVNTAALSCGSYATPTSCPNGDAKPHLHCECNFSDIDGQPKKVFQGDTQDKLKSANQCPSSAPVATEEVEVMEKAAATGLACIQNIRDEINKCKEDSGSAVKACDMKSDKNAETRQQLSGLAQMSQQLTHAGTAEQCKNMGLVTGAAGYGLSSMEKNCNNEMGTCRNSCAGLSKYSKEENIIEACGTVAPADQLKLESEANELARVMTAANNECVTQTEALLQQVGGALKSATVGYASAAQCENQVSSQPVLTNMNLTSCISNPNAAGCPVNCATNPTNAQCTCLTNPTAAGCQGGAGSQLAGGNPNGTNLPALAAGGLGSKLGSSGTGGSSDLGDLSGLDGEVAPPAGAPVAEAAAGGMFNQAGVANAGGGAGTEGAAGKAKNGKGGEAAEEPGLFGGMFQNLKNAAGSLFGSGGSGNSSQAKKNQPTGNGFNAAGLKPVAVNKNLRGLASNGNNCFVDVKGTRVCFGSKNEDIWTKMQKQYSLQYNTFIIDK
jgi:hypothetical protein